MEVIEKELVVVRSWIDEVMLEELALEEADDPDRKFLPSEVGYDEYPVGLCGVIRDKVFAALEGLFDGEFEQAFPGIFQLGEFVNDGGIFKKVSGIQWKQYFQNVIQAGGWILDVANDTVDIQKPPICLLPIEESGFENNDDMELNADVMESYWGYDVYPNIYFPGLATVFPLLAVNDGGVLTIPVLNESMIAALVLSDFDSAEKFLMSSKYSGKRIVSEDLPDAASAQKMNGIFEKHRMLSRACNFWDFIDGMLEKAYEINELKVKVG
jgi:hypothetical protein